MEPKPARQPGERPAKRRCFWEYRRSRESATKKKLGSNVHWSLSWSSSTLPSTLYRREGEQHLGEGEKRIQQWRPQEGAMRGPRPPREKCWPATGIHSFIVLKQWPKSLFDKSFFLFVFAYIVFRTKKIKRVIFFPLLNSLLGKNIKHYLVTPAIIFGILGKWPFLGHRKEYRVIVFNQNKNVKLNK